MSPAEVLVAVGLMLGASAATALVGLALLRRGGELHPRTPVGAPLRWRVAPTPFAVLHRQLRSHVRCLPSERRTRRRRPRGPVEELAAEVTVLALAVDRDLVVASRLPRAERRQARPGLEHRVDQVASLAGEVRSLAAATARPTASMDDAEWRERTAVAQRRTAAHRAALVEVEELERHLGTG